MPKVRKKRMGFVIDMTPLVDITFLLLTFLMFTAKFKSEAENEQQFTIRRPYATPDTTKLPERDLAVISVAIDDKNPLDTSFYFSLTNINDKAKVWELAEVPAEYSNMSLVKVDSLMLSKLIRSTLAVRNTTKFALDADKEIPFRWISQAMDIMRLQRAFVFNFVTEKRKAGEQ